jgi:hypothetical protein
VRAQHYFDVDGRTTTTSPSLSPKVVIESSVPDAHARHVTFGRKLPANSRASSSASRSAKFYSWQVRRPPRSSRLALTQPTLFCLDSRAGPYPYPYDSDHLCTAFVSSSCDYCGRVPSTSSPTAPPSRRTRPTSIRKSSHHRGSTAGPVAPSFSCTLPSSFAKSGIQKLLPMSTGRH